MNKKDPFQPSINQTPQGFGQKAQNNSDELSKYKGFQSVGKLNSGDIREARNRSEKIKADILVCSTAEELKLVREDFGYLPEEIEWVWVNLLTKREKAQITQMTEQKQTELTLENKPNKQVKELKLEVELDFMTMVRQIKETLISLGHETYTQRKEVMGGIVGEVKNPNDYTDEQWLTIYEKVMKMKK